MTIIHLLKLEKFSLKHSNSRKSLSAWKIVTERAEWRKKQDVLNDFPNAKMIRNSRVRFEISHNTYRLVAEIDYYDYIVDVRFIGTHNEYDKINAEII